MWSKAMSRYEPVRTGVKDRARFEDFLHRVYLSRRLTATVTLSELLRTGMKQAVCIWSIYFYKLVPDRYR